MWNALVDWAKIDKSCVFRDRKQVDDFLRTNKREWALWRHSTPHTRAHSWCSDAANPLVHAQARTCRAG